MFHFRALANKNVRAIDSSFHCVLSRTNCCEEEESNAVKRYESLSTPFELRWSSGMEAERVQCGEAGSGAGSGLALEWPGEEGREGRMGG